MPTRTKKALPVNSTSKTAAHISWRAVGVRYLADGGWNACRWRFKTKATQIREDTPKENSGASDMWVMALGVEKQIRLKLKDQEDSKLKSRVG